MSKIIHFNYSKTSPAPFRHDSDEPVGPVTILGGKGSYVTVLRHDDVTISFGVHLQENYDSASIEFQHGADKIVFSFLLRLPEGISVATWKNDQQGPTYMATKQYDLEGGGESFHIEPEAVLL